MPAGTSDGRYAYSDFGAWKLKTKVPAKSHRVNVVFHTAQTGTVDSSLSKPFQSGVPANKLFPPFLAARQLLAVLDGLGPDDTGGLYAWDGNRIPF